MKKQKRRKGSLEFPVIFVAIVVVILIIIVTAGKFVTVIRTRDLRSTANFEIVGLLVNPFNVAHALMELETDERTVGQIALQGSITESIAAGDRDLLDESIRNYLSKFVLPYYDVKIVKGDNILYSVDSRGRRCGAEDEGFCSTRMVKSQREPHPTGPCGIGRKKIGGSCGFTRICCAEDYIEGTEDYNDPPPGKPPVVRCGSGQVGVCDYACNEGRKEILETANECGGEKFFGKDVMKCCAPVDKIGIVDIGTLVSAEVPLLYKTKEGKPPFYCVDEQSKAQCSGDLARGFCEGNDFCCITEPPARFPCRTGTGANGFCLDIADCESLGAKHEFSSDCAAAKGGTYQCCVTATLPAKEYKPFIGAEECAFGEKTSGGAGTGKLIVTLGEK